MTTRASTKTNGETLYNGIRSPRRDRDDAAKVARVDAPEKVDDVVGSRPTERTGNLSPVLETPTTTTATTKAASTASDDEEEGRNDADAAQPAVEGDDAPVEMDGGTDAAPGRIEALRRLVPEEGVFNDEVQGENRVKLRKFYNATMDIVHTRLQNVTTVFGPHVRLKLDVESPFNQAPGKWSMCHPELAAPSDQDEQEHDDMNRRLRQNETGLEMVHRRIDRLAENMSFLDMFTSPASSGEI